MNQHTEKKVIIVVDADSVCRAIVTQRLGLAGYEVYGTANGKQALALIVEKKPHAVISEQKIDRLTGKQLCYTVRHTDEVKNTPFLFLSSRTMLRDKLAAFTAGATDYIPKPFALAELEARLTAALTK